MSTFWDNAEEPIVTREEGSVRMPGVFAASEAALPIGTAMEGGVTAGARVSGCRCAGVLFTDGDGVVRIGVITVARGAELLLLVDGAELIELGGAIAVGWRLVETEVLGRRATSTERFTGGE